MTEQFRLRRAVLVAAAATTVAAALPTAAIAQGPATVQGAGATFPSRVYERWMHSFEKSSGIKMAYRPSGSGDGIQQISNRAVQFAGSDAPLQPGELAQRKLIQMPMLVGGIVPAVNLPGIGNERLRLTGEVLADIMADRIKSWGDARISALNPGVALPATPIRRIVRAEKSGTTNGFTGYLSAVSPAFKAEVGAGLLVKWPGDVIAVEGNDGVSKALKTTPGAIAYVSYDRLEADHLAGVKLRNAAGAWVAAGEAGFRDAIAQSELAKRGDDTASLVNTGGAFAWPITMTSFVLIDAQPARGDEASGAMRYLYWCFMHGDDLTRGTGFAPLPVSLQSRLAARLAQVKPQDGKVPLYAMD